MEFRHSFQIVYQISGLRAHGLGIEAASCGFASCRALRLRQDDDALERAWSVPCRKMMPFARSPFEPGLSCWRSCTPQQSFPRIHTKATTTVRRTPFAGCRVRIGRWRPASSGSPVPRRLSNRRCCEVLKICAARNIRRRLRDWEALAVAQHNGLPTRLLDWSVSPLIATHFATAERQYFGADGAVWCVNVIALKNVLFPIEMQEALREAKAAVVRCNSARTTIPKGH